MYARNIGIRLTSGQAGLTLSATLKNTAGTAIAPAITTGFVEHGGGNYSWYYPSFPSLFTGTIVFTAGGVVEAIMAVNPPDYELIDTNVSSRAPSTDTAGLMAAVEAIGVIPADFTGATFAAPGVFAESATANLDKTGYSLAPAGLDQIQVEAGINARQTLSPILALSGGTTSTSSGTIVFAAANHPSVPRITAEVDGNNDRTSVTLNLPN